MAGLDTVDLSVIIGISGAVFLLLMAVIIICCCSRYRKRRQKGKIGKKGQKSPKANGTRSHTVVVEQSRREAANDVESAPVNQTVTAHDDIDNGDKIENGIDQKKGVKTVENIEDLYSSVDKQKSKDTHVMTSLENVEVFIAELEGDSGNTSRNSPDGAADVIMDVNNKSQMTQVKVIHETERKRPVDNVNNNSMGEVFVDDDVTKLHSSAGYVHVNHEMSFSSGDEEITDRSSVASSKPSVSFHDKTYHSEYDHLRFRTTTVPSKASIDTGRRGNEYYSVGPADELSRVILPDSSGMARVFVSSDGKQHRVKRRHRSEQNLSHGVLISDDPQINMDPRIVPLSHTYHQAGSRTWEKSATGPRQVRHVPERYVIGYRPEVRDNISMRTDGGYAMSELAVPAPRRIYTSASTISSLGRDRSRSIEEPIYYVPSSRRGSNGSAYSLAASTYSPRYHAHRRFVPVGKLNKLHKPLSAYDLHKMKYRSYKGKLAPYSIPL